MDSHYFST